MNRFKLWLIRCAELCSWVALASMLALMYILAGLTGCATTCPPPEVVTTPVVVEVPVAVRGVELVVCHAPTYQTCDQPTILGRVRCVGGNHQALEVCHQQNVDSIEAHNLAVAGE